MKRLSGERPDKSKVEAATGEVQSFLVGSLVDLAYRVRENHHSDFGGIEIEIAGIRHSEP